MNTDRASRTINQIVTGNVTYSIPLIFTDMLSNIWETKKVYIKRLIILFDFSASTKQPYFIAFVFDEKNRRWGAKHRDFSAPPAAICVIRYAFGFLV